MGQRVGGHHKSPIPLPLRVNPSTIIT
jgi:hypothetical protein